MAATTGDVFSKLIGQSWFGWLVLAVLLIVFIRYIDRKCDFS